MAKHTSREVILASVATSLGAALDPVLIRPDGAGASAELPELPLLSVDVEAADVMGLVLQAVTPTDVRHSEGMYFTPREVCDALVETTLGTTALPALVLDPACGGGAFLLAAGRWLEAQGESRTQAVERLRGADLDPVAAATARTALAIWAGIAPDKVQVRAGDGFALEQLFPELGEGAVEAIVGNPPFQNQLGETTARTGDQAAALRRRFDRPGVWSDREGLSYSGADIVRPYVDTAALFLLDALDRLAEGGVAMMILPQSVLATKDVAPIRDIVASTAALEALWIADEAGFDNAAVRVCAPKIRKGAETKLVDCFEGAVPRYTSSVVPPQPHSRWSEYAADRLGVPRVEVRGGGIVADLATTTAGFRDEYYGLADAAVEAVGEEPLRLITSGLIEPLECLWGHAPCRFAKQRWNRLGLDRARMGEDRVARWVDARRIPKLLVATQTRVIEAVADPAGTMIPVTPVISVEPFDPASLWRLAAVLTNPVTSVLALRRTAGAALAANAIKLSAAQLREVPLPSDHNAWQQGADLAKELAELDHSTPPFGREALLVALGVAMCEAYEIGVDQTEELVGWWADRLGIAGPVVPSAVSRAKMVSDG